MQGCCASSAPRLWRATASMERLASSLIFEKPGRRAVSIVSRASCESRYSSSVWLWGQAALRHQTIGPDTQLPAAQFHRFQAKCRLGHRHNLHPDLAGLALSCCSDGSVLTKDNRMVYQTNDDPRARPRCGLDGCTSSSSQTYSNSLGPRFAVRE